VGAAGGLELVVAGRAVGSAGEGGQEISSPARDKPGVGEGGKASELAKASPAEGDGNGGADCGRWMLPSSGVPASKDLDGGSNWAGLTCCSKNDSAPCSQ